ncbi:hypothetical protein ACFL2J_00725 [Candidatus Omnitrophota bacterium]
MKASKLKGVLFVLIFVCGLYSYTKDAARDAVGGTTQEETKVKKPDRQVQDKKDAIQIAKDYLEEEDMQGDYRLTRYLAKLEGDVWHVVFLKKMGKRSSLEVESIRIKIEQSTAQIIEHEEQSGFFLDKDAFR